MREGWREVALGEVLALDREAVVVEPDAEYRLAGVYSFGRGLFPRDPLQGSGTSYKQLHRLRAGQLVLSKLKGWEGAIAVVSEAFDGFVLSPEFPTFSITGELDERYLSLLCGQPSFWEQLQLESRGMGGRRERVHPRRLLEVIVALPDLAQQRRIVDLMASIGGAVARPVAAGARRAAMSFLASAFSSAQETRKLGSLASMRSGPSWSAADESSSAVEGSTPVLKITNTRPDGQIRMDECAYVVNLPSSVKLLDQSSLVLIRTNGNRDRIGNVYRATPEITDYAVSAFQISVQPLDPCDRDYLYWFLRWPSTQQAMTAAASGSTGLGNLAIGWLRAVPVPWLDADQRVQIVDTCEALEAVAVAAQCEADASERVRVALLDDLLTGSHEIPESYDVLLEQVS